MRDRNLDRLRLAAHARHQLWSQACWWWCPSARLLSGVAHFHVVEEFYDALEGKQEEPDDGRS